MNNPLRYAGTTFYQADWDKATEKGTVLQVMRNPSWMAPYVACMLVGIGMLAHFGAMLVKFLRRRAEETSNVYATHGMPVNGFSSDYATAAKRGGGGNSRSDSGTYDSHSRGGARLWFPVAIVAIFALYIGSKARMPHAPASAMQIEEFGKLPVSYEGRIKPYDTLARNMLQYFSGRQELQGPPKTSGLGKILKRREKSPAIVWLLDVISGKDSAADDRILRIDNLDLLNTLGLEPRSDSSWLYSWNDIHAKEGELDKQIGLVLRFKQDGGEFSLFQQRVYDLAVKRYYYQQLATSYLPVQVFINPNDLQTSAQKLMGVINQLQSVEQPPPHAVPPTEASVHWSPLLVSEFDQQVKGIKESAAGEALRGALTAYLMNDAATFNRHVLAARRAFAEYEKVLQEKESELLAEGVKPAEIYSRTRTGFEWFFTHFSPFYYSMVLYVAAFVLGVAAWLGWSVPLRRASIGLLWLVFIVHTAALIGRIYISGRPPVTNL
jgi:hypothetical protein